MSRFSDRGYYVLENGPVYFTLDMDRTASWFEKTLGWYSEIDQRDEQGRGRYGCVFSIPPEVEITHLAPFTGVHLFYGEPKRQTVCFMHVHGVEALHAYVKASGWEQITPVDTQPWGGKTCELTTVDGSVLKIFE